MVKMGDFQEHAERPAVITRTYVVGLLSRILGVFCPDDLAPSWLDYLVAKGVVVRDGEGYALPGSGALGAFPADAQLALHRAIEAHARSADCPKPLHHVIPLISSGGAGSVSQSGRYGSTPRHSSESRTQPDLTTLIERLSWDRPQYLKELKGFGSNASAMFDRVIRSLRERAAAAAKAVPDRARQQEEAERQADQRWNSRASGSTPTDIPSLDEFRAIIPQIFAGLTLATQASAVAPDPSAFSLHSIAVSQDPMAKAIRFGRKHLDGLASRIVGINPPQIRTTLLGKTLTATSAVGLIHGLCSYLYSISTSLRLGETHKPEALTHAAKQLGSSVQAIGLELIEQRAVAEIDMLRVLESEASSDPGPGRGQQDTKQHVEAASTQTIANAAADNLAEAIAKKVAEKLPSPERKADADLDEIGLDLLRTAWNDGDGYQPSWRELANAAQGGLTQRGRMLKLQTVVTHLKQRAPRTKALMQEIRTELENRKQTSKAARNKKSLPPEW